MKANGNNVDRLHEIIFENRNKQYGAYLIRLGYQDTVIRSLLIMMGIVSTLFIAGIIYLRLTEKTIGPDTTLDGGNTTVEIIRTIEVNLEKKVTSSAPKASLNVIARTIIDNPEVEHNNSGEPIVNGGGNNPDPNSTGKDTAGTGDHPHPGKEIVEPIIETTAFADVMPEFIGGPQKMMEFLSRNIVYPDQARQMGISGKVYITFVVDEEGNVGKMKILKGIGYGCDDEAIRVVGKMPRWKPGMNNGKKVRVMFNLPINFMIN